MIVSTDKKDLIDGLSMDSELPFAVFLYDNGKMIKAGYSNTQRQAAIVAQELINSQGNCYGMSVKMFSNHRYADIELLWECDDLMEEKLYREACDEEYYKEMLAHDDAAR